MRVHVEFFGIPRARLGIDRMTVTLPDSGGANLASLWLAIAIENERFAADCLTTSGDLRPAYIANLNSRAFVRDGKTPLSAGDTVLVMSADAGG